MTVLSIILVLATEAPGGGEPPNPSELLLPAFPELLWGFIGFALLMAILWKKVFPNLNQILSDRQQAIQGGLAEAETAKQEAEKLRRQYQQQLAGAREQADKILQDTRTQAEGLRADLIQRAEEEARQVVERANADQQAERSRLVQDLRGQVAILSLEIAGRIVGKELDRNGHDELVDEYITQLSSLN